MTFVKNDKRTGDRGRVAGRFVSGYKGEEDGVKRGILCSGDTNPGRVTSWPAVIEPSQEPLKRILIAAVAAAAREDGWAPLSMAGSLVAKSNPSFDPRNYGCEKPGEPVGRQTYLKVKKVPATDGSPNSHLRVQIKGKLTPR